MSQIQSVLFDKSYYSRKSSLNWLIKHKLKPLKSVHITKNYYRYRLKDPKKYKYFRIISITDNIKFVLGFQ